MVEWLFEFKKAVGLLLGFESALEGPGRLLGKQTFVILLLGGTLLVAGVRFGLVGLLAEMLGDE